MRRRDFIKVFVGLAAVRPFAARAQQQEHMRRIGVLMNYASDDPNGQALLALFLQKLQGVGMD